MKLPQKGFLLVTLNQYRSQWDFELINLAMAEYGLNGDYWINHFSIALDELASAGLIIRIGHRLDDGNAIAPDRLLFDFMLSDFGRERMLDTGLIDLNTSKGPFNHD